MKCLPSQKIINTKYSNLVCVCVHVNIYIYVYIYTHTHNTIM